MVGLAQVKLPVSMPSITSASNMHRGSYVLFKQTRTIPKS